MDAVVAFCVDVLENMFFARYPVAVQREMARQARLQTFSHDDIVYGQGDPCTYSSSSSSSSTKKYVAKKKKKEDRRKQRPGTYFYMVVEGRVRISVVEEAAPAPVKKERFADEMLHHLGLIKKASRQEVPPLNPPP